jgi:hypothetical protein
MSDPDKPNDPSPANRTDLEAPRKPGTFGPADPRINRKGRPKGVGARLRQLFGDDGDELAHWGIKIINGEVSLDDLEKLRDSEGAEKLEPVKVKPNFSERIAVWKELLRHHSGNPPSVVKFETEDAAQYDLSLLTEEELDTLERLLEKAAPRRAKAVQGQRVEPGAAQPLLKALVPEVVEDDDGGEEGDEP